MTLLNIHIPLRVKIDGFVKLKVQDAIGDMYPVYTGEVEIEPKTVEQSIETANTTVLNDIRVLKIPYFETTNLHGTTAIIGGNG